MLEVQKVPKYGIVESLPVAGEQSFYGAIRRQMEVEPRDSQWHPRDSPRHMSDLVALVA